MALVLTFLGLWASLSRLAALDLAQWLVAALVISRAVQVDMAVRLPFGRAEGGTGASFVEGACRGHRFWAWGQAILIVIAVVGPQGGAAALLGGLFSWGFGAWCRARVGGITGDLLGAGGVLAELLILPACAAAGEPLRHYSGWTFSG